MALEKKISQLTAKTTDLKSTDLLEVSEYNGVDYDTKKITGAQIIPYKTILFNISQVTTGNPSVNTSFVSSEVTQSFGFSRVSAGNYKVTASSVLFTSGKTYTIISCGNNNTLTNLGIYVGSTTEIYFYSSNSLTGVATDSLLDFANIEIKIIN